MVAVESRYGTIAWSRDMWERVAQTRARIAYGREIVAHLPGKHDQGTHGGGGGTDNDFDDDEDFVLAEPTIAFKAKVGEYEVRAINDPDGMLLALNPSGDPAKYVEVVDRNLSTDIGEGVLYTSAAEARSIADGVDQISRQARETTPPPATPDGDRTAAYENGPALLASGTFADYPVAAYHDAYDDLGGGTFVAIGEKGASPDWEARIRPGLSETAAFADALRSAADKAE